MRWLLGLGLSSHNFGGALGLYRSIGGGRDVSCLLVSVFGKIE